MWGPRGEDEAIIGEAEAAASSDPDSPPMSLEEIAQSNQGSMDAGEGRVGLAPVPAGSETRPPFFGYPV